MPAPRPRTITYGVASLGVSLLIGVAILWFAWREQRVAVLCLVGVGTLIALAWRWGWPRWVIMTVAVVSVAATFPLVQFQLTYRTLIPMATAAQLALELAGCILLFLPSSHRWYRRPRVSAEES